MRRPREHPWHMPLLDAKRDAVSTMMSSRSATSTMAVAGGITARVGRRAQFPHSAFSDRAVQQASIFATRPTDVFITTAPKTGTTWLQQILHQLRAATLCDVGRAEGHMDFDDVYQVVPWAQMSDDLGVNLDAEQWAPRRATWGSAATVPRFFKSHQRISAINRGAKVLCVVRSPAATLFSWYNFLCAMKVPQVLAYPSVNEFVHDSEYCVDGMRFGASLWEYFSEFFLCATLPNVLCLVYEDLHADLTAHLPMLATFAGLPACGADVCAAVAERCSKAFMAVHSSKFDGSWAYAQLEAEGRTRELESSRPAARVGSSTSSPQTPAQARKHLRSVLGVTSASGAGGGSAGPSVGPAVAPSSPRCVLHRRRTSSFRQEEQHDIARGVERVFTPEALAFIDAQWARIVAPATGCASYSEMVAVLRLRLAESRRAAGL